MIVLADESVDFAIILVLRKKGLTVISIAEENPGIRDEVVLKTSVENHCLLITEDKDFGELTFRLRLKHKGILLMRLSDLPRIDRVELSTKVIIKHYNDLQGKFSVLDRRGLRIKGIQDYRIHDMKDRH